MTGVGDWDSRPDDRARASRAAVSPRVHRTPGGAAVSLESVIRRLLDNNTFGQVLLIGRAGEGGVFRHDQPRQREKNRSRRVGPH